MNTSNSDCIFCKITAKQIPAEILFESELAIAFNDIHPQAPTHILIVPKEHIPTIEDVTENQWNLVTELVKTAQQLARQHKIADNGYRLVFNVRHHGGQEVDHIHLHLIGGKPLGPIA